MDSFQGDPLVQSVVAYVRDYMKKYDASHGWDHIERVVSLAHHIYARSAPAFKATLDLRTIHLAALLHDVGDHKYLPANETPTSALTTTLTATLSLPAPLASKLVAICPAVSYSAEVRGGPARVAALVAAHPELAIVQDADRLDAMGAVGIGRMFTFGGARGGGGRQGGGRDMAATMAHLDEKLLRLEGMMKTEVAREVARVRGERLRVFRAWWVEEVGFGGGEGVQEGEEGPGMGRGEGDGEAP